MGSAVRVSPPPVLRRAMRRRRVALACAALLLALLGLPAPVPAQPIRYAYDDLNRLVLMVDERTGEAAFYVFDSVGNLLRLFRGTFSNPASPVGIAGFSVAQGPPGTTVIAFGQGFSSVPADNQVTVGGTPALVTAATEVQITFVITPGSRSGPIVITSPAGTSTSAQVFTVVPIITTVAGTGAPGFGGDGGPATSAQLNQPNGVALDATGALFIADRLNHRIRKVDPGGTITTAAGNGIGGFGGDDGPATAAQVNTPTGVALDAGGNLFIADRGNHRIRRVDAGTGIITTVAGDGSGSFGGDGGPATSAQLNFPRSVVLDAGGNLVIADFSNHRIRRVDALTGVITTVAGTGTPGFGGDGGPATSAQLNLPFGVALDATGNLFIGDQLNQRVRKVNPGGTITTVAGSGGAGLGAGGFGGDGGPATSAQLNDPLGVALDARGTLFIADTDNNRIRKVDAVTGIITTVAGDGTPAFGGDGGPATSAQLNVPFGVGLDASGNLFIADRSNHRIRKVTAP